MAWRMIAHDCGTYPTRNSSATLPPHTRKASPGDSATCIPIQPLQFTRCCSASGLHCLKLATDFIKCQQGRPSLCLRTSGPAVPEGTPGTYGQAQWHMATGRDSSICWANAPTPGSRLQPLPRCPHGSSPGPTFGAPKSTRDTRRQHISKELPHFVIHRHLR